MMTGSIRSWAAAIVASRNTSKNAMREIALRTLLLYLWPGHPAHLNHTQSSRGAATDISPWRKPWELDEV